MADAEAVDDEWVQVRLRFPAVPAARTLLSFGGNVEVVSPLEVRADLASVAADVVARYDPGPGRPGRLTGQRADLRLAPWPGSLVQLR